MLNKLVLALGLTAGLGISSASATVITFETNDQKTSDGIQSATAVFDFNATNTAFTLTLDNTSDIVDIATVLDDFHFDLNGIASAGTVQVGGGLTVIDCTASTNELSDCTSSTNTTGTYVTKQGQTAPLWTTTFASSGTHVDMVAGSGMHPYGIVNASIDGQANLDGLRNSEHNPYLLGPVSFAFTVTGITGAPQVTNVDFTFGTQPIHVGGALCTDCPSPDTGTVPEPGSLALLAGALTMLAGIRRRRRA